jgi:hypothetical protein
MPRPPWPVSGQTILIFTKNAPGAGQAQSRSMNPNPLTECGEISMNIPHVPPAACESGHAELIIIGLVIAVGFLVKAWLAEKRKNGNETQIWRTRIEAKLDQTILNHDACQKNLPYQFVTKDEYKELLAKRNQQWELFIDKFEKLMARFWNHSHDNNGKVDVQGQ